MLELSFKIIEYTESVSEEETSEIITYRDYVKLDDPNKGAVYLAYLAFEKKQKRLWAFADPTSIPSQRYLAVTAFVTLAQINANNSDLQASFKKISELLKAGETDKALSISEKCDQIIALTDPVQKWLNLATAFLFYDTENPIFYDSRVNKEKLKLLNSLSLIERKKMAEWTREYFDKLMQALMRTSPECFVETDDKREFFAVLEDLTDNERDMTDFLNAVAAKSSFERDRLMMYPIKDLYNDMGTFIRQSEKIKAMYDEKA